MTSTTTPVPATGTPRPRKRKRIFMWTFLAIQALFLVWIIVGVATAHTAPDPATVARACGHGGWRVLFTSRQDCMVHYANGLRGAAEAGTAFGAALVIALWVAVDFILGVGRLVVVFARRRGN